MMLRVTRAQNQIYERSSTSDSPPRTSSSSSDEKSLSPRESNGIGQATTECMEAEGSTDDPHHGAMVQSGRKGWMSAKIREIVSTVLETCYVHLTTVNSPQQDSDCAVHVEILPAVVIAVKQISHAFSEEENPFAISCNEGNVLTALVAVASHVDTYGMMLNEAMLRSNPLYGIEMEPAYSESTFAEDIRLMDAKVVSEQALTSRAYEKKADLEAAQGGLFRKLESFQGQVAGLHVAISNAKMRESEMHGRLDRMNMRTGMLRGQMEISSLCETDAKKQSPDVGSDNSSGVAGRDCLSSASPSVSSLPAPPSSSTVTAALPQPSDSGNSGGNDSGMEDDLEYCLLKNRLVMMQDEAVQWKGLLGSEQERLKLVESGKRKLEKILAQKKSRLGLVAHSNEGNNSGGENDHGPLVRSVDRAMISAVNYLLPRRRIRKFRKSRKPVRSLDPRW